MTVAFRELDPEADHAALLDVLTTEHWGHRLKPAMTEEDLREEIAHGHYVPGRSLAFLILLGDDVIGVVAAHDLDDPHSDPQLDFRLRERARGQGIGLEALRHITREVFERHPERLRIEGQTRQDNVAMRKVFARGGYVKEAVFRQAWPGEGGPYDGIGYAILRGDWESGTTTPIDWDEL
ncbi:MAG: GNAT family N-acetyltransferase [Solirubrobacteraceae bacterium]